MYVEFDKDMTQVFLHIRMEGEHAKECFDVLSANRPDIEAAFPGETLRWERRDEKKNSTVFLTRSFELAELSDSTPERDALFTWIARTLTGLLAVARRYLVERRSGEGE